ncbi:ArnT family glycosyltransferase [Peristeroidobacter agariperforans]|uniref:ArnT family glycosyltransferase n=1 Tax=Peristeroidobacter agariperforans TaxID=268404 RepID=UPI0013005381|nr:glycosyltransferase family 39 protein [Peristeroidobacter agariperforans]
MLAQDIERVAVVDSTRTRHLWTLLLICVAAGLSLGPLQFQTISPQDEGILLLYPDLILQGYVPYRDFSAIYPPGTFLLLAGAFQLLGESIVIERLVGVAYQVMMAAAVYLLGARLTWTTGLVASSVMLLVLHFFPAAGAYSMFAALASILFGMLYAHSAAAMHDDGRAGTWRIAAGVLASLAFWFRQEIGVVGTVAILVALHPQTRRQFRDFCFGFALPAGVLAVLLVLIGLEPSFDSLVLDVLHMLPGRKFPVEWSPALFAVLLCVVISVTIAFVGQRWRRKDHLQLARAVAVLSAGLLPSVLQQVGAWHLSYVGCVIGALTVVSLRLATTHRLSRATGQAGTAMLLASIAGAFIVAFMHGAYRYSVNTPRLAVEDRWVFIEDNLYPGDPGRHSDAAALLNETIKVAKPGERLFVGPEDLRYAVYSDTFFYYLLQQLQPASRYLEMNPGDANGEDSGLAADVASADWLILTSRYDNLYTPAAARIPGSQAPNDVVRRLFCEHSKHGVWRLMRRCT